MTGPLTRAARIADAVCRVDGVVGLHGGAHDEIATYLLGERVIGVRLDDASGEIHIVVDTRRPAHIVGNEVRAVAEAISNLPMTVVVADLAVEQQ